MRNDLAILWSDGQCALQGFIEIILPFPIYPSPRHHVAAVLVAGAQRVSGRKRVNRDSSSEESLYRLIHRQAPPGGCKRALDNK